MSSADTMSIAAEHRATLLDLARRSIAHGLDRGQPLPLDPTDYPEPLRTRLAAFVTLNLGGELRGCIGHLEAIQALALDVTENAFAAAFRDPRFPPLSRREFPDLSIHISVLSPPEPMTFSSEADLLAQIRPGIDGLILSDGQARGTFLPSVWESLPRASDFLNHLKRKAGLPAGYWSDRIQVARYTTESFGD
jgi:AmmeMemoRadiSam system protein A